MKHGWLGWLAAQAALALALTAAVLALALMLPSGVGGWIYTAGMWAVIPLTSAVSAYRVTRKGLSPYAAWVLPCAVQTVAHWLILGYPPSSAMMPMLTGLVSLVAAAAGEVMNERARAGKKRRGR